MKIQRKMAFAGVVEDLACLGCVFTVAFTPNFRNLKPWRSRITEGSKIEFTDHFDTWSSDLHKSLRRSRIIDFVDICTGAPETIRKSLTFTYHFNLTVFPVQYKDNYRKKKHRYWTGRNTLEVVRYEYKYSVSVLTEGAWRGTSRATVAILLMIR